MLGKYAEYNELLIANTAVVLFEDKNELCGRVFIKKVVFITVTSIYVLHWTHLITFSVDINPLGMFLIYFRRRLNRVPRGDCSLMWVGNDVIFDVNNQRSYNDVIASKNDSLTSFLDSYYAINLHSTSTSMTFWLQMVINKSLVFVRLHFQSCISD